MGVKPSAAQLAPFPGTSSMAVTVIDGEAKSFSAPFRYVWPSELDLMAGPQGCD